MPTHEKALAGLLAVEIALFGITGENFFTRANAFEIARLAVELGLLALALTPVIVTGGIDLSVGSMMGLAAVVFGSLWRDHHLGIAMAAACALAAGENEGGDFRRSCGHGAIIHASRPGHESNA